MLRDSYIYVQFVTESEVEMFLVQGGISELNFGYTAEMGGYVKYCGYT